MPGAGNQYIADSVILELSQASHDCVLVMWSGLQRIDLIVDDLAKKSNIEQPIADINYYPVGDYFASSGYLSVIKSGNEFTRGLRSLLEMLKLQSFLQNKKQPYYFMSYINYWNSADDLINRNFGIYKYPKLKELAAELDFSRFIFAENNDCLYEVCSQLNSLEKDNFHPSTPGVDHWMCNYVYPRLKSDKFINYGE